MAMDLDLARLRGALAGEVIGSDDPGYDEARALWNGVVDRRPAAIARCSTAEDVLAGLAFAREQGLRVAVRGGGHNVAGLAAVDGGLVIDLSPMKEVEVDPDRRTVRAGPGLTIAELDAATQAHGLAVPMGVQSITGIAGLTLSGGLGWLRRKHGMSCDNVIAADVVTADGTAVTATEDENADLLWGLRGGGGNFGVVTSFEYRAHPVGPEVMMCFVVYPGDGAAEILRSIEAYMAGAPDEVSPVAVLGKVPAAEFFPEEWHGRPMVAVVGPHLGRVEEGERVLQPLRELGDPIADLSGSMPFVDVQKIFDEDYPDGDRYYWKSLHLPRLSEEATARIQVHADAAPSLRSSIDVWYQGGAMGRVGPEDTAIGDRSSPILIGLESNWSDPAEDDANIAWARRGIAQLEPFASSGAYLNFPGFLEEGDAQLRGSFGRNYDRLVALKREYDPENVFSVNQNIKP